MDCCQAFSLQADTFRIENVLFGKEIIINLASLPAPTKSQRLDAHPFYKVIVVAICDEDGEVEFTANRQQT